MKDNHQGHFKHCALSLYTRDVQIVISAILPVTLVLVADHHWS